MRLHPATIGSSLGLSSLLSTGCLASLCWSIGLWSIPCFQGADGVTNGNDFCNAYAQKAPEVMESIPLDKANPSLWWIKERLEQNDQPWIDKIMIGDKKVRVVVISNLWIKANYLDRFSFLYKLGQEAQMLPQTYVVELTDRRNNVLGTYSVINQKWNIVSEQMDNNPFRVTMPSVFMQ